MRKWSIIAYNRKGFELFSYEFKCSIPFWLMNILAKFVVPDVSWYSEIKLLVLNQSGHHFEKEIDLYRHPAYKD